MENEILHAPYVNKTEFWDSLKTVPFFDKLTWMLFFCRLVPEGVQLALQGELYEI